MRAGHPARAGGLHGGGESGGAGLTSVALTFDDGPDPRGTPAVLDALARADATATFFVLGDCVERSPELLDRVLAAGHAVELHGHAHLRHTRHPFEVVERDLLTALRVLRERGVEPAKWRLPWGDLADYSRALAAEHGLTLAGWTADSHDWRGDAAEEMFAALELAPGGIVLMHDGVGSGARRPDCRETARLVGPLVDAIRGRGWEPGPLPARLPMGNPDFGVGEPR